MHSVNMPDVDYSIERAANRAIENHGFRSELRAFAVYPPAYRELLSLAARHGICLASLNAATAALYGFRWQRRGDWSTRDFAARK